MILNNAKTFLNSLKRYIRKRGFNIERIFKFIHFYRLADKNGVVPFRLSRLAEEYTDDYFAETGIPRGKKEWYYARGIPTFKVAWYGLTEANYNDYISDFDFYAPCNYLKKSSLIHWFDDKLSTFFILSSFKGNIPKHFFYIKDKKIAPMDVNIPTYANSEDLLDIIPKGGVALKSCIGGHGKGFFKVELCPQGGVLYKWATFK